VDLLQIDLNWALACGLVWTRLGLLLGLSPMAQAVKAPPSFWVLFTLALSGTLCIALNLRTPVPATLEGLIFLVLAEATLGALMGLALHSAFAAFSMAGRIVDLQMGLGMGAVLDPVSRSNVPMLSVALSMLALSIFFGGEGHHALLRGIARSLEWVPPGGSWQFPDAGNLLMLAAGMFSVAVVVIAPTLFILLLIEIALSVASRVLPQMNIVFIGMPIKTFAGLIVLALSAPAMAPVMEGAFRSVFTFWQGVLQ